VTRGACRGNVAAWNRTRENRGLTETPVVLRPGVGFAKGKVRGNLREKTRGGALENACREELREAMTRPKGRGETKVGARGHQKGPKNAET